MAATKLSKYMVDNFPLTKDNSILYVVYSHAEVPEESTVITVPGNMLSVQTGEAYCSTLTSMDTPILDLFTINSEYAISCLTGLRQPSVKDQDIFYQLQPGFSHITTYNKLHSYKLEETGMLHGVFRYNKSTKKLDKNDRLTFLLVRDKINDGIHTNDLLNAINKTEGNNSKKFITVLLVGCTVLDKVSSNVMTVITQTGRQHGTPQEANSLFQRTQPLGSEVRSRGCANPPSVKRQGYATHLNPHISQSAVSKRGGTGWLMPREEPDVVTRPEELLYPEHWSIWIQSSNSAGSHEYFQDGVNGPEIPSFPSAKDVYLFIHYNDQFKQDLNEFTRRRFRVIIRRQINSINEAGQYTGQVRNFTLDDINNEIGSFLKLECSIKSGLRRIGMNCLRNHKITRLNRLRRRGGKRKASRRIKTRKILSRTLTRDV